MFTSYGSGRYQASETDVVARSRLSRGGERAVLRFGGVNSTPATEVVSAASEFKELTDRGMCVCNAQWSSSSHWGNDTAQTRAGTGKTYMQGATWSAASGKVLLSGGSMGGLLALLWALNNPTLVAAVAVGIPVVSPINVHDNNRGSFAASIEAAYTNLAGWNAAKATHDPLTLASSFASLGVPIKVWASNTDTITLISEAQSFATTAGATLVNMGDIGHAVYATYAAEAAAFLSTYA